MIQVDTNILVRILLNDVPDQAEAASHYLDAARARGEPLLVAAATVSEVAFLLSGPRLALPRDELVLALTRVLGFPVIIQDRPVIERALELFANNHDDWDDCLVAAYALERTAGRLLSFDRGLDTIPGIARIDPGHAG